MAEHEKRLSPEREAYIRHKIQQHEMLSQSSNESLLRELDATRAERDELQAFKDWCHAYLDGKGIPHHPPGTHGAAGCRIGDRMDYVFAMLDELKTPAPSVASVHTEPESNHDRPPGAQRS